MDLLTVEHLTKTYGTGENAVHALDDVSFSVPRGQFLAIIGPSGSGKSTLLHILGGVDRPTSGHVYMNGRTSTPAPTRRWRSSAAARSASSISSIT